MSAPETRGAVQKISHEVAANDGRDLAPSLTHDQAIVALPVPGDLESIPSHPPGGARLSLERARQLTDSIRIDAQGVRAMLLRAYEGSAHIVLGYENFGEYCAAEFGMSARTAYRSLNAGRVDLALSDQLDTDAGPIKESVARELAPLLDRPDELREAYAEATATAPETTAANARETVERRREQSAESSPRDVAESSAPPRTQATVADAIGHLITSIRAGESTETIGSAIAAAQRVLTRRRMGTSPGALADCVSTLLDAMSALLRGAE